MKSVSNNNSFSKKGEITKPNKKIIETNNIINCRNIEMNRN